MVENKPGLVNEENITLIPHHVDKRRYQYLADGELKNGPVVYWMSRDQRVDDNWALLYAQERAMEMKNPLLVVFCLAADFLGANLRHYSFLLLGLAETQNRLARLRIPFRLLIGNPAEEIGKYLESQNAGCLVTDFDPLRIKRGWKENAISNISIPVIEVDAHNIVPCRVASEKQEYAAYTLRPKIQRKLNEFLTGYPELQSHLYNSDQEIIWIDTSKVLRHVKNKSVVEVGWVKPGEKDAKRVLEDFISNRLESYPENRNNPCIKGQSALSPFLHFGHISAQRVALAVKAAKVPQDTKEVFLEELIIRRELADNFCYYNDNYDTFAGFPAWSQETHNKHRKDCRQHSYSLRQLEEAETAGELWNACQLDLRRNGKLHGYLRMYWAKKILEWTESVEAAQEYAIYLNDKYSLDGRDPNGYCGVAWSIGGVHDRAWPERPIFGKVRYMNSNGCKRKFNIDVYVNKIKKEI